LLAVKKLEKKISSSQIMHWKVAFSLKSSATS